jgi:hypothetical protein
MARELLGIATGAESEAVKLAAVKDALPRGPGLVWDGVWKVVVGVDNTVVAEGDLNEMLTYLFEYGWRVEDAERQARQANS